jgi:hypothetical protein
MCLSCGCGRPEDQHGDSRHITLIDLASAAAAAHITLADAARNILDGLAPGSEKQDPARAVKGNINMRVAKATDEKRYTLGLAYPALRPDVGKASDGYRDFVTPEVLEQAAWEWMAKHREINIHHQDGTTGHATVVESYIYRGPDWVVQSPVDKSQVSIRNGDWLLGVIWDDLTWPWVKAGVIRGWSPEGTAKRRRPAPETLAALRH